MNTFKRKIIGLIVASCLILTSCGSTSTTTQEEVPVDNTTLQDSIQQDDVVEDDITDTEQIEENETTEIEETTQIVEEVSQVIYDQNDIKITYQGLGEDWSGTTMKVMIENNSATNYTVQVRNFSVNGYMLDPVFSADVASGKKANSEISLMGLDDMGITSIGNVEFNFNIFNTETFDDYLPCDKITLDIGEIVEPELPEGQVMYDENNIKITYLEYSVDGIMPEFKLLIENNSSTDITVQARDFSINGFMIDPTFSADVCVGKKAIDGISIFDSDLEDNSITTVENFEVSLHIFDAETWDTIVDTEPITINVQ